jgi:tRNA(adenine34) deaminase
LLEDSLLNHRVQVTSGILQDECRELLQRFFQERRKSISTTEGTETTDK